jgi:hypothetical protein
MQRPQEYDDLSVDGGPGGKTKPKAKFALTKEQKSLRKLVLGLTKIAYKFDPTTSHGKMAEEIANDLEKYNITLHKNTIEKYLTEAVEELSE